MDEEGFHDIKIIAPDAQSWKILSDFDADPDFLDAVDIIGYIMCIYFMQLNYPFGFVTSYEHLELWIGNWRVALNMKGSTFCF